MKTLIYTVAYDSQFAKMTNSGWGCGYCMIPETHKAIKKCLSDEETDYPYFEIPNFNDEITYMEKKTFNGINYLVVGFDTAHSWNNKSHDFDYVLNKTLELQKLIENI